MAFFTPFAFFAAPTATAATFISASGGTITTDGDYRVHTFAVGSTNFQVFTAGTSPNQNLEYLILGGGGGGSGGQAGTRYGAGGASGTIRTGSFQPSVTTYSMVVGGSGAGGALNANGSAGGDSSGFSVTATGGNGGQSGGTGGSNADYAGGTGASFSSGAGAGARANGESCAGHPGNADGGIGLQSSINGTATYYGGGGGGGEGGTGGNGGGGNAFPSATDGTNGLGGGGGGTGGGATGKQGGTGTVIVRYKFQ
jgi:hypothetical protein